MIRDQKLDYLMDKGGMYQVELFDRVESGESEHVFQPSKLNTKLERVIEYDIAGFVTFPIQLLHRVISFENGTIPEVPIN